MIKISFILLLLGIILTDNTGQKSNVTLITYDGAITPACSDFIKLGLESAEQNKSECLIIKLNTPGGLLKSTRVIVSDILESKIPIVVYVSPGGAQAASAGVFITMAAHIAAMSPGTNIGAAHPVSMQGERDSIMSEKATNDAAAFIRSISEKRNRNIKWAEDAVRKSLSLSETEALKKNVIDLISPNIEELLKKINERKIETVTGKKILNTVNAKINEVEMTFSLKLLTILSDPNIAYILFMIGLYGLLFEIFNPGVIFPGVIGGICIILAFYSMHTLPINYAGLALIIFAIILFILEIKVVSHGILSIGGVISLIIGSIMLINVESGLEVVKISWEVVALFVILTVLFFAFAITLGIKAQKSKPTTGTQGLLKSFGEAITDLNPDGEVRIHGEIWNAESIEGKIEAKSKVEVVEIQNLKLKVKNKE
ncbi:MAG: serine protease [Ignavibacteria bacterium RIFOXYB2_FULL_35_12]|nr:MAG: serine protease [Ignavibacteria bacterium GWA2_36_19]OGU54891.1 MAG: serine protease [Ignavibacteria bacterium GWC2_35_8]OGU59779.1 MAG: serine protease [Ignavibacteria bacterium GWF2_35_20]OGU78750.1 MAG: serine protease [Ignavibacteria bacterium RIFOXYA2_FULL_35_9]OGU85247.1 MAG: serine protease [Ignavibacteria bacterium RIFOXYA12_FULL_35_25]OGU91743.1 MAG: serine protease [Ignavibacteria bacterium RIFOXYC12_FULL_35_11]OGU97400.1 MAG: serine protease [Ignavibacteria bacterium RIFOXY